MTWGRKAFAQKRRLLAASLGLALLSGLLLGLGYCSGGEPEKTEPLLIQVQLPDGSMEQLELEGFIAGVVAGEMPASFHPQALRAQAVAARTYVLRQRQAAKHGAAAVCCDSACCQAWLSREQLEENWGEDFPANWQRIEEAVAESAGEVLLFSGQLIDAVFCSTCGGMTEDVSAVWGGGRPYLTAHPCAYCQHSSRYSGWRRYSLSEAAALLECSPEQLRQMSVLSYTAGGRVEALSLGELHYSGVELRSRLGLDSAAFSWLIQGDELVFLSLGYGHGAGLCQYGADGMGKAGYSYRDILSFYYPGTELGRAEDFF